MNLLAACDLIISQSLRIRMYLIEIMAFSVAVNRESASKLYNETSADKAHTPLFWPFAKLTSSLAYKEQTPPS